MKILILTPLFPPDLTPSAQYAKELAGRLNTHEISVILYGRLPESVANVKTHCIDRQTSILRRTTNFLKKLNKLSKTTDFVIVQNGPSVELPSLLSLWFSSKPFIFTVSDKLAAENTNKHWFLKVVHNKLKRKALAYIYFDDESWPDQKPTIHPLKPFPADAMQNYEKTWNSHLDKLTNIFNSNA